MKTKKLLITGGAGFIGSNFIHYMLKKYKNLNILNYDKLTYAGNLENLRDIERHPNYTFVRGDLYDQRCLHVVFKNFKPDYVVNFAAETHVDRSILDPSTFISTNVLGTQNLLDISLKFEVERYVQVSTDEVYGSLGDTGCFTEETPLDPHSPYSASKAAADLLTKAYYYTYNLPINITRCSNNYGPYQFPEKLIPLTIYNCLSCKNIPLYGDGLNVRDWLHVEDHCTAIDLVINKGAEGEIYNIGGNNERSNIDLVKLIIRQLADAKPSTGISEDLITYVEDRKGHDRRYAIDSTKIRRSVGWIPSIKFEDGIGETIEWYLNNQGWLNSVINKKYMDYYRANYKIGCDLTC